MFYEEQKRDKIKAAQEEVRKAKEEEAAKKILEGGSDEEKDASEEYPIDDSVQEEPIQEGTTIEPVEEGDEDELDEGVGEEPEVVKKGSEVSDDIKDSLETDDPWILKKQREATE
jgi:hypothetical protein